MIGSIRRLHSAVTPSRGLLQFIVTLGACLAFSAAAVGAIAAQPPAPAVAGRVSSCEPAIAGTDTHCGFVDSGRGYRLRTLLTRPRSARAGRLPAILFVQWLSCDAVSVPAEGGDGWAQMLRGLIQRSGVIVARTEKPGMGESGGPACSELGYAEELEAHRAALNALRRSELVHPDSIFIFGASMGGTMAPLLARDGGVRGIMVWGTTGKTWVEHMIAIDRRVLQMRGVSPDSVHALVGDHALFHALHLVDGRLPVDIIAETPRLAATWARMLGTDSTRRQQYGRPLRFHQEAQRANWEGAWASVDVPVLIVRGEYDWIMPDDEHRRIAEIVGARVPGRARFVTHPRMDHNFLVYTSERDAFRGTGGVADMSVLDTFLGWLAEQRRAPR